MLKIFHDIVVKYHLKNGRTAYYKYRFRYMRSAVLVTFIDRKGIQKGNI